MRATARAHSNIALVKYWGKRDAALNLPAVGSISLTLEALFTETTVRFGDDLAADSLTLNGARDAAAEQRVSAWLDLVRRRAGIRSRAEVTSRNNFPTGAGLASSASGFAALALAATQAADLQLSAPQLSVLARRGSGSAARSLFGGFVQMHRGERDDGTDAFAEPLAPAEHWPLEVVIAVTARRPKATGSTAGMQHTRDTSPYYAAWVESASADLAAMRRAVLERDFATLGEAAEHSCNKMHALMLSARPGLLYWIPTTVAVVEAVLGMRRDGVPVYYTIDAGPQVKAVCPAQAAVTVETTLRQVPGVQDVIRSGLGPAAQRMDS